VKTSGLTLPLTIVHFPLTEYLCVPYYCLLDVGVHPDVPTTGRLDARFPVSLCLKGHGEAVPEFQAETVGFHAFHSI
jgi:hypothetical protein